MLSIKQRAESDDETYVSLVECVRGGPYSRFHPASQACDARCPAVDAVARPFDTSSDAVVRYKEDGAHLFVIGDSTSQQLHTSFCNQVRREEGGRADQIKIK